MTEGWGKGIIAVNGVVISRYWQQSMPQKTVYISSVYLRQGRNEIVFFETDRIPSMPQIQFSPKAIWENTLD